MPLAGDVTDPAVRAGAIAAARERWGGLDLVVNNAGVGALGRFAEALPERLRQIMELNFFAAVELTRGRCLGSRPVARRSWSTSARSSVIGAFRARANTAPASSPCVAGANRSARSWRPWASTCCWSAQARTRTEFFDHALASENVPWENQPGVTPEFVARRTVWAMERRPARGIGQRPGQSPGLAQPPVSAAAGSNFGPLRLAGRRKKSLAKRLAIRIFSGILEVRPPRA